MHAVIAWWDLAGSPQTVESLREFLREEAVSRYAAVPGLRLKFWISDRAAGRWGAVFLWESAESAERAAVELPPRAAELIGGPPAVRLAFDVEATVEGVFEAAALGGRGLLWEG